MTDDEVKAKLAASVRSNYVEASYTSLGFAHLVVVLVVVMLWSNVDPGALMLWAGVQSTIMITQVMLARTVSPEHFVPVTAAGEAVSAAWWTALPLLAFPEAPDWQVVEGLVLVALLLSTLSHATPSRALHLAATVPIGTLGAVIFAVRGEGAAQPLALAFLLALPFTISAGDAVRKTQRELFESSLRNESLAERLQAEGRRLRNSNEQLEIVNSHLDEQARRDALTGVYNRAGFLGLLNRQVIRHPGQVVVCYLDLDTFKRVNDAFGHRFGDMVLTSAAHRLSRVLGPNEVLARQGGDEFTLFGLLEERGDDAAAALEAMGNRILSVFHEPFLIENRRLEIRASVGIVWLAEENTADDLMRFADTALYKAKELGRNRFAVFDDAMRTELDRRTKLQTDLGLAFERSEILPYFQPIIDISTGAIATAEALARWERSDGVRTAAEFIDTARDLGMLDRINDTVTQKVVEFQQSLGGHHGARVPITVNVSPLHLDAMLNRLMGDPAVGSVAIEITEDGIFSDLPKARRHLERARSAGIRVLLDDFGVGFSSLSIATQLPIDGFKIDRGFVASLAGDQSAVAAVESIIRLAERLDLHVIAEGVETVEQLDLLRQLGVGFVQGHLFSEAVPAATFAGWLADGTRFDLDRAGQITN